MKLRFSRIQTTIEILIVSIAMMLLWSLGLRVGLYGGQKLNLVILPQQTPLPQLLFAVIEFLVNIKFFIMLGRQILPGGIKELVLGQMTLTNKSRYFPAILALGVIAGLVGNAIVIFIQQAASYLK